MLSMKYKIFAALSGRLIFFILFFSANVKVTAFNKLDSIIPIVNTYIKNEQYNDAIMFLKQVSSDNNITFNEHLMDFDYSIAFITKKIIENKKGCFYTYKIKPLICKLEKLNILNGNSKAYNFYCIGLSYKYLEKYSKSIFYLKKSYYEFKKLKNEEFLTYTSNRLALIYSRINDYSKAEFYIQKTLFHLNNYKKLAKLEQYYIWHFSYVNAFKSKNYNKALERLDSASNYINFINNDFKADLYNGYGLTYKRLGKYIKAEESFIKAIKYRKSEKPVNELNLSKDLQNYSELLSITGRVKEAIKMGERACSLITQVLGNKSASTSLAYSSLAGIYFENKQYVKAIEIYNRALLSSSSDSILKNEELFPAPSSVIYLPEYISALKGKALVLYNMSNEQGINKENILKQSLKCYSEVINHLEKSRSDYQFDEGKLILSENEREVYNQAVKASYDLYSCTNNNGYINIGFNITERSRASVLLEKVSLQSNIHTKGDYSVIFAYDQRLRKEISELEKNISENMFSANNIKYKLNTHLFQLIDIQESFFSLLKNKYPNYYNTWLFPQITTINQVQNKLQDNESFIEYYLSDSALFSIVISKNKKYFNKFECCYNNIAESINKYRDEISVYNLESATPKGLNSLKSKSYSLYSCFIKPIKEQLNNKSIIISADGIINYLPFETLVQKNDSFIEADYGKLNYMVFDYQISYAYSATLYNSKNDLKAEPQKALLAIAPDYKTSNTLIAGLITRAGNASLKGAKEEVLNINSIIKGDVLYGKQSSESMFKRAAGEYSILHLAMHGETDNSDPLNSQLFFENGGSGEDGLLYAREIYNMQLRANLVVLSACNTGTGKLRNGEGVMSIARAFTYAGCPSVVMTLWSVKDLSSTNLMRAFYKNLSEGNNKSEALQKAKIKYILNSGPKGSHPLYWAGYVMVGNKAPVKLNSDYKIIYTSAASLGVLSLLIFFVLRIRKAGRS